MLELTIVFRQDEANTTDYTKAFWKKIAWPVVPRVEDWFRGDGWSGVVEEIDHDTENNAIVVAVGDIEFVFDELHPILTAQGWVVGLWEATECPLFKKTP